MIQLLLHFSVNYLSTIPIKTYTTKQRVVVLEREMCPWAISKYFGD
jgi:hypothetical protein